MFRGEHTDISPMTSLHCSWEKKCFSDERFGFCLMKRLDSSDEKMGNYHEHMQSVCVCVSDHKLGIVF